MVHDYTKHAQCITVHLSHCEKQLPAIAITMFSAGSSSSSASVCRARSSVRAASARRSPHAKCRQPLEQRRSQWQFRIEGRPACGPGGCAGQASTFRARSAQQRRSMERKAAEVSGDSGSSTAAAGAPRGIVTLQCWQLHSCCSHMGVTNNTSGELQAALRASSSQRKDPLRQRVAAGAGAAACSARLTLSELRQRRHASAWIGRHAARQRQQRRRSMSCG